MPSLGGKSRGAVKKDVRNRVLGLHREVCAMGTFMGKNFSRRRAWREQREGRARGDSCVGAWSGGSPGRGRADSGSVERPRLGEAFEPGVRTSADEVLAPRVTPRCAQRGLWKAMQKWTWRKATSVLRQTAAVKTRERVLLALHSISLSTANTYAASVGK